MKKSCWRESLKFGSISALSIFIICHLVSRDSHVEVQRQELVFDLPNDRELRILTGREHDIDNHVQDVVDNIVNIDQKVEEEMSEKKTKSSQSPTIRNSSGYTDYLEHIRRPTLMLPQDVLHPEGYIDVGFILINLKKTRHFDYKTVYKIERTFESMMTYSSGTPLHFIVITDQDSLNSVGQFFAHFLAQRTSEGVIVDPKWRKSFLRGVPKIKFSFVQLSDIKNTHKNFIQALKNNTEDKEEEKIDKYSSDLFYIGPLYYRAFVNIERFIFIDVTDLEFFSDIEELHQQFDKMQSKVMGVGLDMSPHYRKNLKRYLELRPNSDLGLPGPKQGLNTGVVLYHLENMRRSHIYNENVDPLMAESLMKKFLYNITLGDQDWFTNLCWDHPDLFYILPCTFNAQTSLQYLAPPWESVFDSYHYCDAKKNLKIVHRNGCGPKPQLCGYDPDPESEFWKNKSFYVDIHLNVEFFWEIVRDTLIGREDKVNVYSYL